MSDLKQNSHELSSIEQTALPLDVLKIAQDHGEIIEVKRFRARNWRTKINSGFAIKTKNVVVVIEENCKLHGEPAWSVQTTSVMSLAEAVDGLYCHTAVKVSSFGHNVLASNPQLTNTH